MTLPGVTGLVVKLQQVRTEVAVKIAPHGMNVVRAILSVIELDEKGRRLNAVLAGIPGVDAAGPREMDVLPCPGDLLFPPVRQ